MARRRIGNHQQRRNQACGRGQPNERRRACCLHLLSFQLEVAQHFLSSGYTSFLLLRLTVSCIVLDSYQFIRPSIDEIVARYIFLFGHEKPEVESDADDSEDSDAEPEDTGDVAGLEAFTEP